jgi:hypothetical protein
MFGLELQLRQRQARLHSFPVPMLEENKEPVLQRVQAGFS